MIAHRGLSGIERENTAAAFIAAGKRSYHGIETDVHVTADGEFAVIHDDSTLRVAGVDLKIEQTDFETLRKLRLSDVDGTFGRQDLVIPSLREYIGICARYAKTAVLELKNAMPRDKIARIADIIRAENWLSRTIFISFSRENLVHLRKLLPTQPAQLLVGKWSDDCMAFLKEYALDIDIEYRSLTPPLAEALKAENIKINCWTVDSRADAEALVSLGVDYITSNILE